MQSPNLRHRHLQMLCGYAVYHPPDRNYIFDQLFAKPDGLPPGTPSLRVVENLSYHQTFTARTNES